jgi:membrane fusion protein, multidrug efflux system
MAVTTDRIAARRTAWWLAPTAALLLVAGCSDGTAAADVPQPVLVMHPGDGAQSATAAFAGEIHARQESTLSFRIGGNLVRRLVDAGDRVHAGQVLAELDPGDQRLQAQATQAQLAAAQAELARAGADRARYAQLARQQLVSRSTLDAQDAAYAAAAGQVRAIRAQLDVARNTAGYTRLRAPRDGVIASREAEAGQVVAAGQAIFTLAGDAGREVAIALPESSIRDHHVGEPALVELWSAGSGGAVKRVAGNIREIAPGADPQTRTYAARVALATGNETVELGQSARVYLQGARRDALAVPLSAIQPAARGSKAVWVVDPTTHTLRLAPVHIGEFGSDGVPVFDGVSASDWIVAAGGHLLHAGQHVAPVDRDNRPVPAATAAK